MKSIEWAIVTMVFILGITVGLIIITHVNEERLCQQKYGKTWHSHTLYASGVCISDSGEMRTR